METKKKGDISEQAFILLALQRGYSIARPIGDRLPYDCILDNLGKLFKVQVKTAYFSNAKGQKGLLYSQGARNSLSNKREITYRWYKENDFDVLATYDPRDGGFFLIPGGIFIKAHRGYTQYTFRTQRIGKPDWGSYKDKWEVFNI